MDDMVEIMMQKANWLKAVSLSSHSGCHQEAGLFIAAAKRIIELEKHIEALKSVCENYIPAEKLDQANDEVILLCKGNIEEIGRKLLNKP